MAKTRKLSDCPILGSYKIMQENTLPTINDVMRHFYSERNVLLNKTKGFHPPKKDIANALAKKLKIIWTKSSIPTVLHFSIVKRILEKNEEIQKLKKNANRNSKSFRKKIEEFRLKSQGIFDICSCKCRDFTACSCPPDKKVPIAEREFLHDQRTVRRMVISGIDQKTSSILKKRLARKLTRQASAHKKIRTSVNYESSNPELIEDNESSSSTSSVKDTEFICNQQISSNEASTSRLALPTFTRKCDRRGISDRAAADLASSLLYDVNNQIIIDRSKVRRERSKTRKIIQEDEKNHRHKIVAVFFDGRKDKTLKNIQTKDKKFHKKVVSEEHITLVEEPESVYLGHLTVIGKNAANISNEIFSFLEGQTLDKSSLIAIGSDGETTNTGRNGGVIRRLEEKLEAPMHWFICQLHLNELPLRHLTEKLDGKTSGPRGFCGVIGQNLQKCETLPVVAFEKIQFSFELDINLKELSTDQQYLLQMCKAVSEGSCPEALANKHPGALAHSRWLTLANRLLRLYIATHSPSSELNTLATYIIRAYAPSWFTIKVNHRCIDGPSNLQQLISRSQFLKGDLKKVVHKVIQDNAYFAHPENILAAMIFDERKNVRELAVRRIQKCREKKADGLEIRKFVLPKVNFLAKDYIHLINWNYTDVTEPPMTRDWSDSEIQNILSEEYPLSCDMVKKVPCHSQAVERMVKVVTESANQVCGSTERDGFIRARLLDRKIMPVFNTKSEFKV